MSNDFFRQPQLSARDRKVFDAYLCDKPIKKTKLPEMKKEPFNPNNPNNTFHLFRDLPVEIQDIIWSMAAIDLAPRTIELRTKQIENAGRLELASQYIHKSIPCDEMELPKYTKTFASPTTPPTLLSVSKHAREVTMRYYELSFRPILSELLKPDDTKPLTTLQKYVETKMPDITCPNCLCCTHGIWVDFSKDIFVPGKNTLGMQYDQTFFMHLLQHINDLYLSSVFPESRLSLHNIQTLALPIHALFTRNLVTFSLGYLSGINEIMLVRTRGFDRKPYLELADRTIEWDTRPSEGKDPTVYAARRRGFRVLGNYMHVREAQATAQVMHTAGRLRVQGDYPAGGPQEIFIWTATVKKEDGKRNGKGKTKKFLDAVSGRTFKNWVDKNYMAPNFG